jgi:hypothetical protein
MSRVARLRAGSTDGGRHRARSIPSVVRVRTGRTIGACGSPPCAPRLTQAGFFAHYGNRFRADLRVNLNPSVSVIRMRSPWLVSRPQAAPCKIATEVNPPQQLPSTRGASSPSYPSPGPLPARWRSCPGSVRCAFCSRSSSARIPACGSSLARRPYCSRG